VPGRIMSGIQFFEAQIDDQLLPRAAYDSLLARHGFTDVGTASLTPMQTIPSLTGTPAGVQLLKLLQSPSFSLPSHTMTLGLLPASPHTGGSALAVSGVATTTMPVTTSAVRAALTIERCALRILPPWSGESP